MDALNITILNSTTFFVSTIFTVFFVTFIYKLNLFKDYDKDYKNFNSFFSSIRHDLTSLNDQRFTNVSKRINEVLLNTVNDGKKFRGLAMVKCFKDFSSPDAITESSLRMSYALGWILEIMQAAFLIYDDIMDKSLTRRGKQCWYLYNNNGVKAIDDGSNLRLYRFKILKKYCYSHPCYLNFIDVIEEITNMTMDGQILDCITTPDGKRPNFSLLNDTRYSTIVAYKTSYYTFVLPVRLAMYLANIVDEEMHSDITRVSLRIGHLFQVQDDFLDIYGNPKVTGKIGTDIEDGKCSWIAVQAYKKMNENSKIIFEENYGQKQGVTVIKDLFDSLQMETVFKAFEASEFCLIQNLIKNFQQKYNIELDSLTKILNLINKRTK